MEPGPVPGQLSAGQIDDHSIEPRDFRLCHRVLVLILDEEEAREPRREGLVERGSSGGQAPFELGLSGFCVSGFETPRFILSLGDGRVLGNMSAGGESGPTKTIRRADLYDGLRREAGARGLRVEYGKRLVDAQRSRAGVVARFEDGSERETDLLIGADGIHSRVRTTSRPFAPGAVTG